MSAEDNVKEQAKQAMKRYMGVIQELLTSPAYVAERVAAGFTVDYIEMITDLWAAFDVPGPLGRYDGTNADDVVWLLEMGIKP